ncbi:Cmx/CmrA family chloramphenicol efflux MFS transporter [Nonomuraea endophytica]|uniref:DHA1 family chloramphenicol resistance protein-like MFS transporter n=1 Tax=Nonomuraea endophytica TaxID=714136 RepID=A0A7W8A2Y7_9ACTN|nr:Cmx/CmrA family chloramphenicol efflux MFS transporter [Nonomuraea endophytica]MBB5078555.1 DHA1 family chloramphenicol resistance protein-like MFS transporter [Nonomuraea endophytica]
MPMAVFILGLAVFAQGTSEFMLSGLLPDISADLGVSLSQAGLLTSAFAIGMVVGAPVLAAATLHWPRRRSLVLFLSVFAAAHVVSALTPDYAVLLAARVVSALANAGFWAVAAAAAVAMVPAGARARALAIVVGGVTVACVAGVPAGAVLGQLWGWRSAFWAVAVLSALSAVAILRALPSGTARRTASTSPSTTGGGVRAELRALADRRVVVTYLLNALIQGATFCAFTFLAPLVTEVAGFGEGWVPGMLVLFGAGAFLGITLGGRLGDAHPMRVLGYGMTALTAGWAVLALAGGNQVVLVTLVFLQGLLAFGLAPALASRAYQLAAGAPTLAGAFATAAFNVGAAAGPGLGGLALDAGFGFRAPVWVSAGLMVPALAVLAWAVLLERRAAHAPVSRA